MQHSSSRRPPPTFRGFGLCIAVALGAYAGLIGYLTLEIKHTLDGAAPQALAAAPMAASQAGQVVPDAIVKANAEE